ncbi:MAG: hypothetical protein ACTSPM_02195 [Candidatus Heimdallarchaeota archaeon]
MFEVYSLAVGIILFMLGIMMLIWTKNFIILRFEGFHKGIRKKKIVINYRALATYNAILYFITAIPLLTTAIIGFVKEIPVNTYIWIYVAVAVVGLVGILYSNISKQFIQPLDIPTETD